ncbi:MAG TPA: hypothetical protein VKB93_26780 [Thermoanaerobaculia bacterium]|nr:hypothetical protein [Thermoanaerobaculia bacterium]
MRARRPLALSRLIDALARLYVDIETSRRPVADAGIDATIIAFDARALYNWTNIVNEAIRQKRLRELIAIADTDYPDIPELKRAQSEYESLIAEREAGTAAMPIADRVIVEKPPKLWQRSPFGIAVTLGTLLGVFAIIGIVARESLHSFYGVPVHKHNILGHPDEWITEGFKFFTRTLMVGIEYLTLNPLGAVATLVLGALVLYAVVRWHKPIERMAKPAIIVPVMIVFAISKSFFYDMPTLKFERVLEGSSWDMASFDIPPLFASRAKDVWQPVVCSRVGGDAKAGSFCGDENKSAHLQRLDGRYLLDVLFTLGLWSIGFRVVRKLMLPSRELAWNLPPIWRRVALGGAGIALFIGILGVPWAYSRTARSMREEQVCVDTGDCHFRICTDSRECFDYSPAGDWTHSLPIPKDAAAPTKEDVLEAAFREQLQGVDFEPPDRSQRLPPGGN